MKKTKQNFKYINRIIGDRNGDLVIRKYAQTLLKLIKKDEVLGRPGGDNFTALIQKKHLGAFLSQIKLIEVPIIIDGKEKFIPVSVYTGISEAAPGDSFYDVLGKASIAIEALRSRGTKNADDYLFFNAKIADEIYKEKQISYMFQDALINNEFKVYYQPKVNMNTNKLTGCEALVRWIHPELGFISPGDFIPTFEETGLITKLDEFIVRKTCEFLAKCKKLGLKKIPISVNLSRRDLAVFAKPELLTEAVQYFGFDKDQLHFEITESLAGNSSDVLAKAKIIRDEGFKIEIDDFGSGYSCLGMISDIPMDYLKLDITFAKRLEAQKGVVKYVIALAHDLGAKVIAEGVETEEQKNIYRDLGCDSIQGYFYSKPLPEDEFIEYLKNHK